MSRGGDLLQPILPNKNVTFSVMMVEGVEWVCEQLSETQCKPLYPKVRGETIKSYLALTGALGLTSFDHLSGSSSQS